MKRLYRRSQNQCAQRRGQRQRIDQRDAHGDSHRQSELLEEDAGGAAHERHGDENHHEDQRGGEQRDRKPAHSVFRGFEGRGVALVKTSFHRLHHHDGVVHHRADDQHQCEERQQVDGESCHLHESESADKRHDNTHGGNQGGTDVLQEKQHHDQHPITSGLSQMRRAYCAPHTSTLPTPLMRSRAGRRLL